MADISFLNIIPNLQLRSGLEYLQWQSTTFYDELASVIEKAYDPKKMKLNLDRFNRVSIEECIRKNSNINVKITVTPGTNFAIDAGFISPNSVFNTPGIERFLKDNKTNVFKAFKELNTNVINGYCDLTTGKVEGDFRSIPFILFIGEDISPLFRDKKFINAQGIDPAHILSAIILHECGHAFFGLHYLSATVIDNAITAQSIKMLLDEPDKNNKLKIIKDASKVLDIELSGTGVENKDTAEELVILFEKGMANRDYRRTLSLGVTTMSMEVMADLYCSRMGGGLANSIVLTLFDRENKLIPKLFSSLFSIVSILAFSFNPMGFLFASLFAFGALAAFANKLVPTIYDSPYRRVKALLRDQIAYLNKKDTTSSPAEINKMIADAKALEILVDKNKSFFEGTAMQRLVGWIFKGSDFRKTDVENYTADLVNSRLALATL